MDNEAEPESAPQVREGEDGAASMPFEAMSAEGEYLPASSGSSIIHCLVSLRGPRVLAEGKALLIGRESHCDIRISDPAVSREHARIEWRNGAPWLVDLKSRNGTFVNSKPIREHGLRNQDKIRISGEHFTYRQVASMKELRDSVRLARSDARKGGTTEIISAASFFAEDEFRGALGSMGMPEICQMILLSRRSGRLCLLAEGEKEAYLHFVNGQIHYAETADAQGEEAAISILGVVKGYFTFQPGISSQARNVKTSTETLLFEAMRLLDEQKRESG
ncbi:MAG: FHA domain-containing protein [Planctomycetota bacterium]|nr:FHA domain-containing protein [Planctomycetota bacterium]